MWHSPNAGESFTSCLQNNLWTTNRRHIFEVLYSTAEKLSYFYIMGHPLWGRGQKVYTSNLKDTREDREQSWNICLAMGHERPLLTNCCQFWLCKEYGNIFTQDLHLRSVIMASFVFNSSAITSGYPFWRCCNPQRKNMCFLWLTFEIKLFLHNQKLL